MQKTKKQHEDGAHNGKNHENKSLMVSPVPPPLSVGLHGHSWQYLGVRSTSQGEVALVVNERVRFLFT